MKQEIKRLPDAELDVMQALWRLGEYPAATGAPPTPDVSGLRPRCRREPAKPA